MRAIERFRLFFIRTIAITHKETIHLTRDPRSLYVAIGMPVVLILIFGYGVSFDLDNVPIAFVDHDNLQASRDLIYAIDNTAEFDVKVVSRSEPEIDDLLRRQEVSAVVVIPEEFERAIVRGEGSSVQLVVDGSDGTSAQSVLANAVAVMQSHFSSPHNRLLTSKVVNTRLLFNPELRSAIFLVPGLIAYLLIIAMVLLTALTVAREWEQGNMEQLFATPVGRLEIVIGKLTPYLAIGLIQALLVLTAGTVVFDVPVRGSLLLLACGTLLFILCALGQGLLISVLTRNQQVATQVAAVTSLLPGVLLSGFIFPIANMPPILQLIASLFPARYYVELLRGILLKGVSLSYLWPQFFALTVFATTMITIATLRFRRLL